MACGCGCCGGGACCGCCPQGCTSPAKCSFPNAFTRVKGPCCATRCSCRCCCPAPLLPPCPPRCRASMLGCGCCRPRTCSSPNTPCCCCTPGPGSACLRCTRPRNSGFCCPNFKTCPFFSSGSCCSTCRTCGY